MVLCAFITIFMMCGVTYSFSVFLRPMMGELGWSASAVSSAMSINLVVSGLSLPIIGRFTDRYGPKVVILVTALTMGVSTILLSNISSILHLYLLYGVLVGVTYRNGGQIATASLVARWFTEKRGTAMGIFSSGFCLGQTVIIPLSMYLVLKFGWRTTWLILGALLLLTVVPLTQLLVRDNPSDFRNRSIEKTGGDEGTTVKATAILDALKTRSFLLLTAIYFLCGFTDIPVITHWVPISFEEGVLEVTAANAYGAMAVLMFVGTICIGPISDRFGGRVSLSALYLIRTVSFFLPLHLMQNLAFYYMFIIMFGFSYYAMTPVVSAFVGNIYGELSVGRLFGFLTLIHCVGAAVGTSFFGVVFDLSSSYSWAFIISILFSFMATVCSFLIKEKGGSF